MRIGVVVPRYGADVHGGAETAARLLAEHVARLDGWAVDVFTTCARDATTWADELEAGTTDERGVTVHRFRSVSGRAADFDARSPRYLADPSTTTNTDADEWIRLQGPVCPGAIDAAAASDCSLVTFQPYLFWPTVEGVRRLGARAILHPAAHDEAPIRLVPYREVFERAGGIVFWTDEERDLAQRLFPAIAPHPQLVLGTGVEVGNGDASAARESLGLSDRPYILCIGRVDDGKGAGMLARFFMQWKARRPGPHALVFAGPVVHRPPAHGDVIVTGPVSEATKWGLVRGADLVVSPSAYESLSLVVLEAWSAGTAVVVNGSCDVTRGHCQRSGGGLWFDGYGAFEAALDRLLADDSLRASLGRAGHSYVEERYSWPVVVSRYTQFLQRLAERVHG